MNQLYCGTFITPHSDVRYQINNIWKICSIIVNYTSLIYQFLDDFGVVHREFSRKKLIFDNLSQGFNLTGHL